MADTSVKIVVEADTEQAKRGIDSVSESLGGLGDDAKAAAGDVRETADSVDDLSGKADRAGGALGRFVDELAPVGKLALGINEVAELMGRIAGFAGDLLEVADGYKQMAARMEIAAGNGQALEQALAQVRSIANATGSDLESTAALYARLAQSSRELGLSQQDVGRLTETVSKAMAVSGASASEASSALRQLSQALASGVLRGDEFNSMMENAPRLMEALAQSLGVTVGELRKMAEQGKLTAATVVGALQSQAGAIDEQFGRMPLTVGRAVQQLKNEWTVFLGELDRTSGASSLAASAISSLASNLDVVASAAKTAGLAVAAGLVAQAIPAIKTLAVEMTAAAAKAGGLAGAIKSIPTSVKIGIAVIGLDLAVEGARLLGEAFAKLSPEVQASEQAMRRYREELSRQAGDARAAAQMLDQYSAVTVKSAEAVARMGEADRARYAEALAKSQQYWQALAKEAALMEEIGQKGAVSAETVSQRLAAIRQGMEAVAAASRMSHEAVANLIDPQAQALVDAFGKSLKDMADKGTVGAEAVGKALSELRKSFDAGSLESVRAFGQALDELRDRGTISARAVAEEWAQAVGKLSGESLQNFATQAQAAFGEGERNARALADVMDAVLRRAVADAGADWDALSRGISKGAADALANLDVLIEGAGRLRAAGLDAGAAVEAGLVAALQKVKTSEDLQAVAARMREIGVEGEAAGVNIARAFEEARKRVEDMTPGINSVEEAFRKLGLSSSMALKTAADEAQRAYEIIAASSEPIDLKIKAWDRYAQAAIASGDAVRMEMARQQAAVLGVEERFDRLARQAGVTGDALMQTAVSTQQLAESQASLRGALVDSNDELQRQVDTLNAAAIAQKKLREERERNMTAFTSWDHWVPGFSLLSEDLKRLLILKAYKEIGLKPDTVLSGPGEFKAFNSALEKLSRSYIDARIASIEGSAPKIQPQSRHEITINIPGIGTKTIGAASAQDAQALVDLLKRLDAVKGISA